MVLMGTSLLGGEQTVWPTPTYASKISSITVSHGEIDELYVSKEAKTGFVCAGIPKKWDFNTVLWAGFNGNLTASNISDDLANCDFIRIKRRIRNTFKWITLFEIDPSTDPEGWSWFRYDKTARAYTDYDYAIVPVSGGIEGNMNITSVFSCFDGIYIFDPGDQGPFYYSVAEHENVIQRNRVVEKYTALGHTYPYTVSNGMANYDSGIITALFTRYDWDIKDFNFNNNVPLRDEVLQFLTNKNVKLLKEGNGRIWLMKPTSHPTEESFKDIDRDELAQIQFEWVSVADPEVGHDLYVHGVIDVDLDDFSIQ